MESYFTLNFLFVFGAEVFGVTEDIFGAQHMNTAKGVEIPMEECVRVGALMRNKW